MQRLFHIKMQRNKDAVDQKSCDMLLTIAPLSEEAAGDPVIIDEDDPLHALTQPNHTRRNFTCGGDLAIDRQILTI
jgi:hypothetical protein